MEEKFYIFLDIDGVLWDIPYFNEMTKSNKIVKISQLNTFHPESIEALNYLIESLQERYDVKLIISSTWRFQMPKLLIYFQYNGLRYNGNIDNVQFCYADRSELITDYLHKVKELSNFVIIDDSVSDLKTQFTDSHIIATSMDKCLRMEDVENYINFKAKIDPLCSDVNKSTNGLLQ